MDLGIRGRRAAVAAASSGLGYAAARTRGIVACVVIHGLFNAISFVYLLRGGAG